MDDRTALFETLRSVGTMGGDTLADILAPSEIAAVADAVIAAGWTSGAMRGLPGFDFLVADWIPTALPGCA